VLALKNRVSPEIFHCIEYIFYHSEFFSNLRFLWKTEFPWYFSLYWMYFLPFTIFEQLCACPEKQSCPGIFHCIEYTFHIQEFWAIYMRLSWKIEGALNSQYWLCIFYHSGFLSNFVLALKNRVALEFFTVLNILFTFRSFEQLACASLKNRGSPEFTVPNIYIYIIIQNFWAICAFPEKRSCPGIFHCIEKFFII